MKDPLLKKLKKHDEAAFSEIVNRFLPQNRYTALLYMSHFNVPSTICARPSIPFRISVYPVTTYTTAPLNSFVSISMHL